MPEATSPAVEDLESMVTSSSSIDIFNLWKEYIKKDSVTGAYITTRAQKHQALLDLSKPEPAYLDTDGGDNKILHLRESGSKTSKPSSVLSIELAPELLSVL